MIPAFLFLLVAAADTASTFPTLAAQAEAARKANRPYAPALYAQALKTNPIWKEGWWALGTLEYTRDHYPECRDAFSRLAALDAKAAPAWAMQGLCEFGAKEYDPALAHLRTAQRLGVGNDRIATVVRFDLAQLYTRAGDFENAMGLLVDLSQTAKENPDYITAAGLAALWKPMLAKDLPAQDRELVYLAGKAFWAAASRDAADARRDFDTLLEKYPASPGVHYLFGSFELQNEPDRAVAEFQQELKISPHHPGALMALAAEYLRRGEPAKGVPYAQEGIDALPQSAAPHALLGRLLSESGDLDGALKELELARTIAPGDPQPRIALASVYAKLGRSEDAARERREFLRLKDLNKMAGEQ